MREASAADWAREQLGGAELGDARRTHRAVRMLERAAESPSGRISEVFENAAERQAAYDFVRGSSPPEALIAAFRDATLATATTDWLYVVVDGTSLSLADPSATRDFGSVGKRAFPTRGLKCVTSIAVEPSGVPLGLLDLEFWSRPPRDRRSRFVRRASKSTEMTYWETTIERVARVATEAGVKPWLVVDREGDCAQLLRAAADGGAHFTIRAAQDRKLADQPRKLHAHLRRRPILGQHFVAVPDSKRTQPRIASLEVRVARVTLDLPVHEANQRTPFTVQVVWAHERRTGSGGRLDWMLLTDRPILDYADAVAVIESYCQRWRVEDFHRSWKRGHCRVEETQLHRREHVVRWAAMLAAVANRAERLKHLARTQPDAPATIALTEAEQGALVALARIRLRKKTEEVPDTLTIGAAVEWIARNGGYTGKSSGGPPGSRTIARGLERLIPFVAGFTLGLKTAGK